MKKEEDRRFYLKLYSPNDKSTTTLKVRMVCFHTGGYIQYVIDSDKEDIYNWTNLPYQITEVID